MSPQLWTGASGQLLVDDSGMLYWADECCCGCGFTTDFIYSVSCCVVDFEARVFNPSLDPDPDCTYSWDFGDGNYGSGRYVEHIYDPDADATEYTVTLTTTCGGCSEVYEETISVDQCFCDCPDLCDDATCEVTLDGVLDSIDGSGLGTCAEWPDFNTTYTMGGGPCSFNKTVIKSCTGYGNVSKLILNVNFGSTPRRLYLTINLSECTPSLSSCYSSTVYTYSKLLPSSSACRGSHNVTYDSYTGAGLKPCDLDYVTYGTQVVTFS